MKHYNDTATLAERALDYSETVTGAVPVAAPTVVTDGVDCRDLSSAIVRVTADQVTGLNCKLEIVPWLWGQTRTGAAATAATGWTPLQPILVDCLVSQSLEQTFEVKCDAGDRLYLQITATNAALAWATAEVFTGLRREEVQPVVASGLVASILSAMEQNKAVSTIPFTGAGIIAETTIIAAAFELVAITLHLSAAGTTPEDFTIGIDSNSGPEYDTNIVTEDLSVGSIVDMVLTPEQDGFQKHYNVGDELVFAWPNTELRTYGLLVIIRGA